MSPSTQQEPPHLSLPLEGPAGERIDLWRVLVSHGLASLPPMSIDEEAHSMALTISLDGMLPRVVRISQSNPGYADIRVIGRAPGRKTRKALKARLSHILRLDEDLSEFYDLAASDPALSWVTQGAGRMIRSATVFEDVIKTICTTNCAWSATERMVSALCEHLGEKAFGAPQNGALGRAFPSPKAMAQADDSFYRDVMRAGYRGRYFQEIAQAVAAGSLDLEVLGRASPAELPDEELEEELLKLPGVGPYAASHIMLVMGRYSRLILDSWTRPKYARLVGRPSVKDAAIEKRFRRYGRYAGLAFWMYLTRDWVDDLT